MKSTVRFLNLAVNDEDKKSKYIEALSQILQDGKIVLGPQVAKFETNISGFTNRKYGIGVGSGTAALYLAIKALAIPEGSEVITSPLTWVSSVNAIYLNNLIPVFADIDSSLNLSPDSVQKWINPKTAAILAVDFAGQMCDYKNLSDICKSHNLLLIEDSSQAMGAKSLLGPAGSQGIVSATSHNPMKSLAALGEAGSVTTDSLEIKNKLEILRYSGTVNKSNCIEPSINGRLDTFQAEVLNIRLESHPSIINRRNTNALFYRDNLHPSIGLPILSDFTELHSYYTFQIMLPNNRDQFMQKLLDDGIETKIQHDLLVPSQSFYRKMGFKGEFPLATKHSNNSLCLPIHEKLTHEELEIVARSVNKAACELCF